MDSSEARANDAARVAKLSSNYAVMTEDGYRARWSLSNAGNRAAHGERQRALAGMAAHISHRSGVLLDLGCGELSAVPGLTELARIGVDLLFERLVEARRAHSVPLVNADGYQLPLRSGSVDVVTMFTMLSSVLESDVRASIASEVERVLVAGGAVLWYDFRYASSGNRAVRPVSVRELRKLFPSFEVRVRSLTVVPPIARRFGRFARWLYPVFAAIPPMRSHLVALLVKPT
jgi:ubiquinone/menaquinone biosynthesis C-methylase UbiE